MNDNGASIAAAKLADDHRLSDQEKATAMELYDIITKTSELLQRLTGASALTVSVTFMLPPDKDGKARPLTMGSTMCHSKQIALIHTRGVHQITGDSLTQIEETKEADVHLDPENPS